MAYIIRTFRRSFNGTNATVVSDAPFDKTRYGTPWAGIVCKDHTCIFPASCHYTGHRGQEGDLIVEAPAPGSVWKTGVFDYTIRRSISVCHHIFDGTQFWELAAEDVDAAVAAASEITPPDDPYEDSATDDDENEDTEGRGQTKHVAFTAEEIELLQKRSGKAGLDVTAYIHRKALSGRVATSDTKDILAHTAALQELISTVIGDIGARPGAWLYSDELSDIHAVVRRIEDLEIEFVQTMKKEGL